MILFRVSPGDLEEISWSDRPRVGLDARAGKAAVQNLLCACVPCNLITEGSREGTRCIRNRSGESSVSARGGSFAPLHRAGYGGGMGEKGQRMH